MEREPLVGRLRQFCTLAAVAACATAQTAPVWTRKSPAQSPPGRSEFAMAYDAARGRTILFGGLNDGTGFPFGDTWAWDGTAWTHLSPANAPAARFGHTMAYDAVHGQIVLFGGTALLGNGGFADVNDTWIWDGANWTAKNPQIAPSPREGHAMAYDAARGKVILFGGVAGNLSSNCVVPLSETWSWDGANWTKLAPATSPYGRFQPALVYDAARGRLVMFGGGAIQCGDLAATAVNETWTWDGANWTKQSPQNSPAARLASSSVYDLASGHLVLFGGLSPRPLFAALSDTWVWDGANWTQSSSATVPAARYDFAAAYDMARRQTVIFGGASPIALADLGDTWTLDSNAATSGPPALGSAISAGAFGAFPSIAPGSWIEIYGASLAGTTRSWNATDFAGVHAPTALEGVQVTIGGQNAFVDYVAANPGQVNAQVPSGVPPGIQQLTVTNGGVTSVPLAIQVNATQPGLLAPASFQIGGNQYVVAQALDGTYILPTAAIPGISSRPAHPGETITIYGVGFGPVTPGIPAGQIATQNNQLAASLQMMFGSATATTSYAGLAPTYVGLYLFDVAVPPVPGSPLVPLTFTLAGAPGAQTLYIAVQAQ